MKMTLYNFDLLIDGVILKRGKDYYFNGCAQDVEELEAGSYQADVIGTDMYTVEVNLDGEVIDDYLCDCPYEGEICKHIVAVLYELREIYNEKDSSATLPAGKTKKQLLAEILDTLSPDELKTIITEQCKKDKLFHNALQARFSSLVMPVSPEIYRQQLDAIVRSLEDKYGRIGYSQISKLVKAVDEIVGNAYDELEKGNYQTAFYIGSAIVDTMTDVLSYTYDRRGDLEECLDSGLELLEDVAEKDIDEALRKELFLFQIAILDGGSFQAYDHVYRRIDRAINLIRTSEEKEMMRRKINDLLANPELREYERKRIEELMLDFILAVDGEMAASHYMNSKQDNSVFRKGLIEKAIRAGEYDKALSLVKAGIEQDRINAPGLVRGWLGYQLKIYENTNDRKNELLTARTLFLTTNNMYNAEHGSYYKLLKKRVNPGEWTRFVDDLIEDVKKQDYNYRLLTYIYKQEKRWEDFLQLVYDWPSLERVADAERSMADIYPVRLADLYAECILGELEKSADRSHYQKVCAYIRRVAKLGGEERALELVNKLKALYPRRSALLDELRHAL